MSKEPSQNPGRANASRDARFAAWLVLVPLVMLGLSFAASPFYRLFCQATGFNGTTQRAAVPSENIVDRNIIVRFDTNMSPALDWDFQPVQRTMTLKLGENGLAFFRAHNKSHAPLTGTATFNVTPEIAGAYFSKVQCFCFTEQTLAPGASVEMPVSFFVDPAILNDPDAKQIPEITLSYTFFKTTKTDAATAATPKPALPDPAAGRG